MIPKIKRLAIPVLFLSLLSCGNKKAEIVEREKKIKREMEEVDKKIDSVGVRFIFQGFPNHPDSAKLARALEMLSQKNVDLKNEYDSLEMELKKY